MADELLVFMKSEEKKGLVRIVESEVPAGILQAGTSGRIIDAQVKSKGPDDSIYIKYAHLREKVARGNTFLKLKNGDSEEILLLVYANKKFSGGPCDEDYGAVEEKGYERYLLSKANVAKIVRTEKQNGDAAHLSGRVISDEFYWCFGSKNVHMLVRNESDIDKYVDGRYHICKKIAKTAWKTIQSLPPENLETLKNLVNDTHGTLLAEILQPDYQHVVPLRNSDPELCFITLTPTYEKSGARSLTAKPPHEILQLLKSVGLRTTAFQIVDGDMDLLPKITEEIRSLVNSEGEVLYLMDGEDNTCGMIKIKTYWYIQLRAFREKGKSLLAKKQRGSKDAKMKMMDETKKRISEIKKWLKFSDEVEEEWCRVGIEWLEWLDTVGGLTPYVGNFPNLWKNFTRMLVGGAILT